MQQRRPANISDFQEQYSIEKSMLIFYLMKLFLKMRNIR